MALLSIAVAVRDRGGNRVRRGDIVGAKTYTGEFGNRTLSNVLWIRVDTNLSIDELLEPESLIENQKIGGGAGQNKRRYNIPLARLARQNRLDFNRLIDESEIYQPLAHTNLPENIFRDKRTLNQRIEIETDWLDNTGR